MRLRPLLLTLVACDILLLIAGAVAAFLPDISYTHLMLFNLESEFTLPAAYSGLKLALFACLAAIVTLGLDSRWARRAGLVWAAAFLFLAFDELGGIHERVALIIRHVWLDGRRPAPGTVHVGDLAASLVWILPGILLAILSSRLWRELQPGRFCLAVGAGIFVTGAFLIDGAGDALLAQKAHRILLEEGCEFLGLTVMIYGLCMFLSARPVTLTIGRNEEALPSAEPS